MKEVYEYLRAIKASPIEMTLGDIKEELGLSIGTNGISNCENLLEKAGAIERLDARQNMAAIKIDSDQKTLIDFLPRNATTRRHVMRGLEKIVGPLRHERVMFRPERLAASLEMKWGAVNNAIREICKLEAVDYVPPFRGRAIHLLCPEKPFNQLDIDFVELEERKQSEYEKLQRVIALATTKRCRQVEILEYFGDTDRDLCGSCDNCNIRASSRGPKPKFCDEDACMYVAQVALSGAARTKGRFGKTIIAQMLTGSTNQKMKKMGLNKLSTFGLLRTFKQTEATSLIESLIESRYLVQNESTKFRPVVQITDAGKEVMSGKRYVEFSDHFSTNLVRKISIQLKGKKPHLVKEAESPGKVEAIEPSPEPLPEAPKMLDSKGESSLFDDLDFSFDSQLPTPAKGDESSTGGFESNSILETSPPPETDTAKTVRVDSAESNLIQPSYFWTWKLLSEGYTFGQLKQVRNLESETIFEHVIQAVENGHPTHPNWLLRDDQIEVLQRLVDRHGSSNIAVLIGELPSTISSQQLMLFLKCQVASS